MRCRIAAASLLCLLIVGGTDAQVLSGGARWLTGMRIVKAEPDSSANPLVFRLYGPQEHVRIRFEFRNGEPEQFIIVGPQFFENLHLALTSSQGEDVPASVKWVSLVHHPRQEVTPRALNVGGTVLLQPGDWVEAECLIHPSSALEFGPYRLVIDSDVSEATLRFGNDTQWRGPVEKLPVTLFSIDPITDQASREKSLRLEANELFLRRDYVGAIAYYQQLRAIAPSDVSVAAGLGMSYSRLSQFQQAVVELEKVLPSLTDVGTSIHYWLAQAHVAIGNDDRAFQVLRMQRSESDARAELERLRAGLRQRGVIR